MGAVARALRGRRRRRVNAVVAALVLVPVATVGLSLLTATSVHAHRPAAVYDQGLLLPRRGAPVGHRHPDQRVASAIASGRLLFVGASYSVGWGATRPDDRYEYLVARRLDRPFAVNAVAGTGFLDPGERREGTFAQRLRRIPTSVDPRILVLQGGRDDRGYPPEQEYRAAVATIELARARFVHAQVVVLGPIPSQVPVPTTEREINRALARACATAGAGYIDAIAQGWITRDDERAYVGTVAGHPDDRGYAFIADRMIDDLPAALDRARPATDPQDEADPARSTPAALS